MFCAILPYPIFSNHTNIPESVSYDINNFHEIEIQNKELQTAQVLPLTFEVVDLLIPIGTEFEIFDIKTNISYFVKRTGGIHHADIEPISLENAKLLLESAENKWSWNRRPVIVKLNELAYVPASLSAYPHGYTNQNYISGHLCLHFENSKMDGTKEVDFKHQQSINLAKEKSKDFLKKIEN